jgi:hypothetical protein
MYLRNLLITLLPWVRVHEVLDFRGFQGNSYD